MPTAVLPGLSKWVVDWGFHCFRCS